MKAGIVIISLFLGAALLAGWVECAQPSESEKPSIFWKEPPPELTKQLRDSVERFAKLYPASEGDRAYVRETVASLRMHKCGAGHDADVERGKELRELGTRTIPVLSELMSDRDSNTRLKAMFVLGLFVRGHEDVTEDYAETRDVLIVLFRQALFDKSADMRVLAVGALSGIGTASYKDIPEGVKVGLEQAELDDPDPQVRGTAHYSRVRLGLRPPDPDKVYYQM